MKQRYFFLLFITVLGHLAVTKTYAQGEKERIADSLQIIKYSNQLEYNMISEALKEEFDNPDLTAAQIDMLMRNDSLMAALHASNNDSWGGGKVYYTPDNRLKIFMIEGTTVGAYANSMYAIYCKRVKDNKEIAIPGEWINPVEHIYQLPELNGQPQYLLMQQWGTRGAGSHSEMNFGATVLAYQRDSLIPQPFHFADSVPVMYNDAANDGGLFAAYTLVYGEGAGNYTPQNTFMKYDEHTRVLSYSCVMDATQAQYFPTLRSKLPTDDYKLLVTGEFKWIRNRFSFAGEEYRVFR